MLKTSPTKRLEYLLKLPPRDKIARPIAIQQEEKTEIIVSVDAVLLLLIQFSNNAKTIPKITMDRFVSGIPHTTPTAIPVRAECPNASEKNAILLLTIIVPRMPNSGVIIRTARNAFLIKSYWNKEVIPLIYTSSFHKLWLCFGMAISFSFCSFTWRLGL